MTDDINKAIADGAEPAFAADEADRETRCALCFGPIVLEASVVAMVKSWNRRVAAKGGGRTDMIAAHEAAPCQRCYLEIREAKSVDAQLEGEQTRLFLRKLRDGVHTAETLRWLREHGCADIVNETLARLNAQGGK